MMESPLTSIPPPTSSSTSTSLETRELFGGALEISLPAQFVDISNFREVPDNQEIFADSARTDRSFIIELLEHQSDVKDEDIAKYLFHDLCELNGVSTSETESPILNIKTTSDDVNGALELECKNSNFVDHFPGRCKQLLLGQQRVAKYRDASEVANVVNFYIGVVRLPDVGTDLMLTFNDPVVINELSSSSGSSEAVGADTERSMATFLRVFASLQIKDYGIFDV